MRKEYDFIKLKGHKNPYARRLKRQETDMRKIKLTKEEGAIEESLEEYVPVRGREHEEIAAAIERKRKEIQRKRINHPAD